MNKNWKPFVSVCAISQNWLPYSWEEEIYSTIDRFGVRTMLTGPSELSREKDCSHTSKVVVVFGEDCSRNLPWLDNLYRNEFITFIERTMGRKVYPANDKHSAININCLDEISSDYEKHVDTNSVTGLLFACNADEGTGGQLVFDASDGDSCIVDPKLGTFIAFDAREISHFVSPLRKKFRRISVPMNYYDIPEKQYRPYDLDRRLNRTE